MSHHLSQRERARQLRRDLTPSERVLWKHLRNRRFAGFKFRRQHPLGPYFADFACLECQLIVELDGETHLGREEHDERRSHYLRAQGWLVLRIWNTQVYDELDAVMEVIYRACRERKPKPLTPNPSPLSTGAKGARPPLTPNPSPLSTGARGAGQDSLGGGM